MAKRNITNEDHVEIIIKTTDLPVMGGRVIPIPTNVLKPATQPDKSDKGDKSK